MFFQEDLIKAIAFIAYPCMVVGVFGTVGQSLMGNGRMDVSKIKRINFFRHV